MPKGLDLAGEGVRDVAPVHDNASITFAVRALAVIYVHDSEEAQARNLTLRQICGADEYLRERAETLTSYLFCAFGRNCKPVLERFMEGVQSPEDLEVNVRSYAKVIQHNLGLTIA